MHTQFCLCPPRVCFPSPVEVLESNPSGLQSQVPWGFSVFLPDAQVGKSAVGPRTFATVQALLWCNCSPVCGSSAQWLYSGGNGELLQEDTCLMPHLEVCCSQSPCPHRRPLLTRASAGDAETLKVWPGSVSYEGLCSFPWVLVHTRFCLCPLSVCLPLCLLNF